MRIGRRRARKGNVGCSAALILPYYLLLDTCKSCYSNPVGVNPDAKNPEQILGLNLIN